MFVGQIVYLPYRNCYIRYKIKKVCEDGLLVLTFKGDVPNWVSPDDVMTTDQFIKYYKDEKIYE